MTRSTRAALIIALGGVFFVLAGVLFGFTGVVSLILALIALLAVVTLRDERRSQTNLR